MTDRHQLLPTPVRIPAEMKDALKAAAEVNERSLNGEIVYRLRESLDAQIQQSPSGTSMG